MTRSIEVYQNFGTLEFCNKYFIHSDNVSAPATIATNIYNMQKPMQTTTLLYTRWRHLDHDGTLLAEGPLVGAGTITGEMMPIHYAILLRISVAAEIGRPSVKYIHGWPESFQANNVLGSTGITALTNAGVALLAAGLANSNGGAALNFTFRGFSRRKRMRVMGT